jgi:DNA-directed RNA polymerase subunit M/transcription elongation factor TFIIS
MPSRIEERLSAYLPAQKDRIGSLLSATLQNGEQILGQSAHFDYEIVDFVFSRLRRDKSEQNQKKIVNYLLRLFQHGYEKREDILFDLVMFKTQKAKNMDEIESYLQSAEPEEDVFECTKCGSKKTTIAAAQTRSADEPMTVKISCGACGFVGYL